MSYKYIDHDEQERTQLVCLNDNLNFEPEQ